MKFTQKKARLLALSALVFSLFTALFNYFLLPEQVAVQISFSGSVTRTVPKIGALTIPVALCLLGCLSYLESNEKPSKKTGSVIVVLIALFLPFFTLFLNR